MSLLHPMLYPEPVPTRGDVVVRTSERCPSDYVLYATPSPPQIHYSAYARALDVAKRWARRQRVDLWFTENGRTFILLSRHRPDDRHVEGLRGRVEQRMAAVVPHAPAIDPRTESLRHTTHPNALLVGPRVAVAGLIDLLLRDLGAPIVEWDAATHAAPPAVSSGALVIWNVQQLDGREQRRLFDLIDERAALQVIAASEEDVFPRVQRGEFMDALYYRLSIVRFHIET